MSPWTSTPQTALPPRHEPFPEDPPMSRRNRQPRVARLVATLAFLAASAGAIPDPATEPWLRIETDNFVLFSHAPESVGRRVGAGLERLRSVLSRLGGESKVNSPLPTYLYVFANDGAFRPYKLRVAGRPAAISGYFISHPLGNFVAIDGDKRRDPVRIIYHEYLHYFVRNNFPDVPLWFNEGLAEFYSTFDAETATVGEPIEPHRRYLVHKPMMPLERLFAVETDSDDYHEEDRKGAFYAQRWALVHYLLLGNPEREIQVGQFLDLLRRGTATEEAFARAFETTYGALERELDAYVRIGDFPVLRLDRREMGLDRRELVKPAMEVSPMAPAQVATLLGDLVAYAVPEDPELARTHYERALRLAPDAGLAWAGLGFLEEQAGSHEEARALYLRALQSTPGEARIYFLLGRSIMSPLAGEMRDLTLPDPRLEEELGQARWAFQRALELDPDFTEALAGLGSTYTLEREVPAQAVDLLRRALEKLPSRMDVAFNLTAAHAARGERRQAETLIETVLEIRAEPGVVTSARRLLVSADLSRVHGLIENDQVDEALALLDRVSADLDGLPGSRSLHRQVEDMEAWADRRRGVIVYNRAVEAANAGDPAAARDLFDRVLDVTRDGELRRQARRQRDRLERYLEGGGG